MEQNTYILLTVVLRFNLLTQMPYYCTCMKYMYSEPYKPQLTHHVAIPNPKSFLLKDLVNKKVFHSNPFRFQ